MSISWTVLISLSVAGAQAFRLVLLVLGQLNCVSLAPLMSFRFSETLFSISLGSYALSFPLGSVFRHSRGL